jgi:hypothetical protein
MHIILRKKIEWIFIYHIWTKEEGRSDLTLSIEPVPNPLNKQLVIL